MSTIGRCWSSLPRKPAKLELIMRNWRDALVTLDPEEGTEAYDRLMRERRVRHIARRLAVLAVIGLLAWGVLYLSDLGRAVEHQAKIGGSAITP